MIANGLETCLDETYKKNFKYGSGVSANGSGSKACQLFLAEMCVNDETRGCQNLRMNDTFTPGFDIFNRPIIQDQNEAYIRNIASQKYLLAVPFCTPQRFLLDPQNSISASVTEWTHPTPNSFCKPVFSLTRRQINDYVNGNDRLLDYLIEQRPRYDEILLSIKNTLEVSNMWNLLSGTKIFQI